MHRYKSAFILSVHIGPFLQEKLSHLHIIIASRQVQRRRVTTLQHTVLECGHRKPTAW